MCTHCAGNLFGSVAIKSPRITRREFAAVAVGAMGAGLTAPIAAAAAESDGNIIFRGGPIIPITGGKRYAEALAVSGGRIVAVGSDAEIAQRKNASTRVIDLDGRTLLPGFIDPHQHTVTGALVAAVFTEIGYTAYKTRAAVMSALRERAAQTPPASGFCSPISTICCRAATCRRPSSTRCPPTIRSLSITSTCIPRRRTAPLCKPRA